MKEIKAQAMNEGISWYAVGKASTQLKIVKKFQKASGQHGGGTAFWSLPEQAEAVVQKAEIPPQPPATNQTVLNNSYLAAKQGYMQ